MQQVSSNQDKNLFSRGVALVEIVIGSAIIVTAIVALLGTFTTYTRYALSNEKNIQAALLLEEGMEAVRFMRDWGWSKYITPLSSGTTYYLAFNGSLWEATTTPQAYIDGTFLRTLTFDTVYRDGSDDIAASGTIDPNTKKVTVTVTYRALQSTTTKAASSYVTNLFAI